MKFIKNYVTIAVSSLIFGVLVILIPALFPALLSLEEKIVSNSLLEFYYLYLPFYVFFVIKLFKESVNLYSTLTFLGYLFVGTLFYTLGLFLMMSQFNVNNLMMG